MKNKIKFFRFLEGKTQQQVAKESHMCQTWLSYLEREIYHPREVDKKNLSRVLGIAPEAIFPED